ncbi:DUF4164 family protein [Cohaesibacter celericrescens]|uniref:DUF4164 family protein n=1 Tax=Cohaesibacter celericrescens TaxID=2067669 RepID=UPI0035673983
MGDKPDVSGALARLDRALLSLELAVDKRRDKGLSMKALQGDLKRMSVERSDLTSSLESIKARSEKLEGANEEVSRRLGAAMESVRAVLEQHGG